jgi:hypothetical protein
LIQQQIFPSYIWRGDQVRSEAIALVQMECSDNIFIEGLPTYQQMTEEQINEIQDQIDSQPGMIMKIMEDDRIDAIIGFRFKKHNELQRQYGLEYVNKIEEARTAIYEEVRNVIHSQRLGAFRWVP